PTPTHPLSLHDALPIFGPLPGDRRHRFKLDASYEMPFKLSVGTSLRFTSGAPISSLGAHPTYGNDEAFVLPRGDTFSQDITTQRSEEHTSELQSRSDLV